MPRRHARQFTEPPGAAGMHIAPRNVSRGFAAPPRNVLCRAQSDASLAGRDARLRRPAAVYSLNSRSRDTRLVEYLYAISKSPSSR